MASELCMNCFSVKGQYEVCPFCGYVEGTPPAQPHYLVPGTILAEHFIIGTVIGFGGFGITYKAYDSTLGVIVAVKEFYPTGLVNRSPGENAVGLLSGEKKGQYQAQLKRFLMEAQSIAQFGKAKDIVNVYDFFEANNTAYIIMEYVDGVLLKSYLEKQGKMEPGLALNVIAPVIEAVKKIHAQGIIHRDISPDNIFIDGEESIKVFDFGAAQLNDSSEGKAGEKVIKVGYSAPEQYRDKSRQGFYTDIYSVGAILYQMITGIVPIESTEREYKDELKSPMELGIQIEPNIDRAVMEALAVKPELRFQGIQQLEDALHSKRIAEYPKVKLKKRKRRRNWLISTAAAIVLVVGVGVTLFNTILKPSNEMMDTVLKEDEITIWVDSAAAKEKLDAIRQENFVMAKGNSGEMQEKTKEILRENEKITVTVEDVSAREGSPTMDEALKTAKGQGNMPDMFLTDHVSDLQQYKLASMEETVYQSIEPEEYLYMSEYGKYFRDMKELPTGIDTMFLYAYSISASARTLETKKKRLETSCFLANTQNTETTVEISDILKANQVEYADRKEFTQSFAPYTMYAGIMQNEGENPFFERASGKLAPNGALVDYLAGNYAALFLDPAKKEGLKSAAMSDSERRGKMLGNSCLAGGGRRADFKALKNDSQATNEFKDLKTFVVTQNGEMQIIFADRYAVSAESSRNRQLACMRFLWIMLGEPAQGKNFKDDINTPFPINAKAFNEFFRYNSVFQNFKTLVNKKYPCRIFGKGSGDLYMFEKGITPCCVLQGDSYTLLADKAKEYCAAYAEKNTN